MIQNLNVDILFLILNNLAVEDIICLKLVNTSLNRRIEQLKYYIYPINSYNIDIMDISKLLYSLPKAKMSIRTHKKIDINILKKYKNNISKLNLSFNHNLRNGDLNEFSDIYDLNISCCYNIDNLSFLKNVRILNLSGVYGLKDISPLANLNLDELNLSYCILIN
jgi:hypothetical protein